MLLLISNTIIIMFTILNLLFILKNNIPLIEKYSSTILLLIKLSVVLFFLSMIMAGIVALKLVAFKLLGFIAKRFYVFAQESAPINPNKESSQGKGENNGYKYVHPFEGFMYKIFPEYRKCPINSRLVQFIVYLTPLPTSPENTDLNCSPEQQINIYTYSLEEVREILAQEEYERNLNIDIFKVVTGKDSGHSYDLKEFITFTEKEREYLERIRFQPGIWG